MRACRPENTLPAPQSVGARPQPRCHSVMLTSLMSRNCSPYHARLSPFPFVSSAAPGPRGALFGGQGGTLVQTSACSHLPPMRSVWAPSLGVAKVAGQGQPLPQSSAVGPEPPAAASISPRAPPGPPSWCLWAGVRPHSALPSPPPQPRAALHPCLLQGVLPTSALPPAGPSAVSAPRGSAS